MTEQEIADAMIRAYGKLPDPMLVEQLTNIRGKSEVTEEGINRIPFYDPGPEQELTEELEELRQEHRLKKDLDFLNRYGSDPKQTLLQPGTRVSITEAGIEELKLMEQELHSGKYDGKKLEHDITGDTLEDVAAVMKDRYTEHQRLILAALLYNSCTPGKTDFTVFTDLIQFRPGLTSRPHRAA